MEPLKEVVFDRTYNAPLAKVWRAWTDPEMLKQWWGPDNVTIPECTVDLRVGGKIYIVMEAGEAMGPYKGTRWSMNGEFTVIEPQTKLAYHAIGTTEGMEDETYIDQDTEITFTEEDSKTRIHLKATVHRIGPAAQMAIEGMQHGFTQQLQKLEKFLVV